MQHEYLKSQRDWSKCLVSKRSSFENDKMHPITADRSRKLNELYRENNLFRLMTVLVTWWLSLMLKINKSLNKVVHVKETDCKQRLELVVHLKKGYCLMSVKLEMALAISSTTL